MISRGQVYMVDLNPAKGREQKGRQPVLVVSSSAINRQPLAIAVVVGTGAANVPRDYPTNVRVSAAESGLPGDTVFRVSNSARSIPAALQVPLPPADFRLKRCPK